MIPLMDFQRRAMTGPVSKADDFDLDFAFKVRELVDKYEIRFDPMQMIVDDRTADAVFHAGVELLADVGLFMMDCQRVIRYDKDELYQLAKESQANPADVTLGRGADTMSLKYRKGTDTWAPTNYGGGGGVVPTDYFIEYTQSLVQEERVKGTGMVACLARLGDIAPQAGTPSEVHVALWEQAALKEALRRVGRPGLNLGLLCTVSTPSGTMAMIEPGLRENWNTQIGIHIMPEQKLMWSRLLLAQFCQLRGIQPWQSSMSCIGALCRDGAEAAIGLIANGLGQLSYGHGQTMSYYPSQLDGMWATRDCHWAFSAAARASERHLGLSVGTAISGDKAWRTPLSLWQSAGMVVTAVPSGMGYTWFSGHTGLEARFIGEMMDACTKLTKEQCNDLAIKIMERVEALKPTVPAKHVDFPEAYDLKTVKPLPKYEAEMRKVMDELTALGMPL
jgi:methylamine--corrinoid protein Co-methyltransferase